MKTCADLISEWPQLMESDIHYPTDSTLLGDGVRVLTRAMKKISRLTGVVGDRTRSTRDSLINIGCHCA